MNEHETIQGQSPETITGPQPDAIEKHSKRLQKTLFTATELRRSKSLENCSVKDDVLWQFGKTSEDLAKNFTSFCQVYYEKQDQVSFLE